MARLPLPLLPILAGLIAHHGFFIRGEWHLSVPRILLVHALLASALVYIVSSARMASLTAAAEDQVYKYRGVRVHAGSVTDAVGIVSQLAAYYLASLFTSITVYRLFFHNLSGLPGPKLAAVSKLWHVWHARNSNNHVLMEKLYAKYGKLVRTGPNEITVFHPDGIELLDGAKNKNLKDVWYDVLKPRTSAIFTRDEQDHKDRRHVWVQSLSTKAMDEFRPRIAKQAQALQACIASYGTDTPININDVMSWFSFDAMGEVVFSNDFGMMASRVTNPAVIQQKRALAFVGPIADVVWIAQMAFSLVPFIGKVRDWMGMVAFCEKRMMQRMEKQEHPSKPDMASWFINEYHALDGVVSAEHRNRLLSGTAVSAVVAGSDTTRASLTAIWWYLSKYPNHAAKIQAEIDTVDISDANALALLPHLNGVINETLRLVPPAMTGGGRITSQSGLWIDDFFIPPGTKITAPKWVIHRLPESFEYPDDFIPERWYSRPELVHNKRSFGPFSFGGRQCVGKVLAYAELRLVTAALLKRYNVDFAPGYDPQLMWDDMVDQVTAHPGLVLCTFSDRK